MAGQYNLHSRLKEPLTGGGSMGRRLDPCREEEGLISRTPSQFMQRKFYKIHGLLACVHPPTVLLALGFSIKFLQCLPYACFTQTDAILLDATLLCLARWRIRHIVKMTYAW